MLRLTFIYRVHRTTYLASLNLAMVSGTWYLVRLTGVFRTFFVFFVVVCSMFYPAGASRSFSEVILV